MQQNLILDPSAIHVWHVNLKLANNDYQQLKTYLNPEEQQRLQRYTHQPAQQQFLAARGRLKQLLAGYLGTTPGSIQFELGQYRKPRLAGTTIDNGLVFNLSHSGTVALIAISKNRALGVDVERIDSKHNLQGMAQRCFSDQELRRWSQSEEPGKTIKFYDYWCAKEAFLKATGRGLALGMQHCVIDLNQPCYLSLPKSYQTSDWQLHRIDVGKDYRAFVAGNGDSVTIISRHYSLELA
ncbi:MAG: 4'-phosphopantetheinyl transferase superfamily protein [Methylococcales bacterium]